MLIGTRGSVDNQDKIVSAAVCRGLNIPSPLQMQGVPQEAVRRLQRRGGVPRVRGVRRGGVRGLQLRGGRGGGHGDTPHGHMAAGASFIPTSFRINTGFVLFAQGGKITKIADKL